MEMDQKNRADGFVAKLGGVTKRYGDVVALDRIDLELRAGELLALLGPNGAGKTTSVRMLLGLSKPDSGTARVFGLDPRIPANRVRTGAILQTGSVPSTLKVGELIEMFSAYYPRPMGKGAVIRAAGLEGIDHRRFADLSGGQKQRTLFALSLCGDPDLLVLDEPTVGLDVEARRGLWEQIRGFIRAGKSILLTTHYLDEADSLADRVMVINGGRIVAAGSPTEIKSKAADRKIRCVTKIDLRLIQQMAGVISAKRDGDVTEILTAVAERVVSDLLKGDSELTGLEVTGAGLEEAFISLTKQVDSIEEVA